MFDRLWPYFQWASIVSGFVMAVWVTADGGLLWAIPCAWMSGAIFGQWDTARIFQPLLDDEE